jgi:glycosyltransferase involved in cell wall biosynthesis
MKKKILLLSDDLRSTSGIATMSKEFVLGTVDKYDWVQLGAMITHPDLGKVIDLNDDVKNRTGIQDASVKLYPSNGYGDMFTLRKLMEIEKPDAILHFTDPHYWQWLYDNEQEIRQTCPILFYHIWDNLPDPQYNRDYYESCDWLGCISKQTYGIVHRVGKMTNEITYKPLEDWQISYVPHGINENLFKPIDKISEDVNNFIHGDKKYDFVLFYNNRNIRRKQPSDVIMSYKLFCDSLPKDKAEKCLLLMHTTPIDENGTDLVVVKNTLCPHYDVKFTGIKLEQDKLNEFYNAVDCTINIANNEGFGLTTAESIMAGTPIIVNVTGGLQDQCGFDFNADDYIQVGSLHNKGERSQTAHGEWVIPVWSSSQNLNGSVPTPYIYEDRVNLQDVSDAIGEMYKLGKKKRKANGQKGREWAIKNLSSKVMCDSMSKGIETVIENYKPKERFNLYKIS